MKYRIKLFVEFILWEIRRIIRFIEKCLKSLPYLALFSVLWWYFTDFFKSPIAGFFYSLFWIFLLWLFVQLVKFEWETFIDYKKWLENRRKRK